MRLDLSEAVYFGGRDVMVDECGNIYMKLST